MRLWHKDLLEVLPSQQLVSQWRECCAIARNIAVIGTPNHILVNKVMDYPISHFWKYSQLVLEEMTKKGFSTSVVAYKKFEDYILQIMDNKNEKPEEVLYDFLFWNWHNDRYFWQCLHNLQEKYDCGGISDDEMKAIEELALFYV